MRPSAFLLVLLFSGAATFLLASAAICHVDDHQGLLGFKSGITHDPSGILSSWKPDTHCCKWVGVTCSDGNRVDMLQLSGSPGLPNAYLSGSISPSISRLQFLTTLTLQNLGNLSGPIPDALVRLNRLTLVQMENNKFSGPLPRDIGNLNRLEQLLLMGNRIQGPIPDSISKLTQLTVLLLGDNLLAGPIPSGIQNLKKLASLNLERNQLSGTIPNFFPSLTKLESISLSHNKLSGAIPPYLPKDLIGFTASHNDLTGPIPPTLGDSQALQTLDLSWNRLSGRVPARLGNLSRLGTLDVSHNRLAGPVPALMDSIHYIDLSYNKFHLGVIPTWITAAFSLNHVGLASCGIEASLEDWTPENLNTVFLYTVDISENAIFGSPVKLFNASEFLREFRASGNRLRFNMGRLKIPKLMQTLDVARNLAYGYVPRAAARLKSLNVSYNHLCGEIPATNFTVTAFVGNDCLCGSPLPPCKV